MACLKENLPFLQRFLVFRRQQLKVKSPSNINELNHLQHNIVKSILSNKSKQNISVLHSSFEYLKSENIINSENDKIIIIHGTDTVDLTAKFIDENIKDKKTIYGYLLIDQKIKPNPILKKLINKIVKYLKKRNTTKVKQPSFSKVIRS